MLVENLLDERENYKEGRRGGGKKGKGGKGEGGEEGGIADKI